MIKKNIYLLIALPFFLFSFFLPRYFSHLQYDALEDELLAINNNIIYSFSEQLWAPDFTHPPLWYLLMEYPTSYFMLDYDIGYYRLAQVLILFLGLLSSLAYFWRKIPHRFIVVFLLLFLTNVELIHLTAQHRMYSLVISFGVFYVFDWFYLIKYKKYKKWQDFFIVGIIASLGFFSNYSMIWLIPIFPLVYLLSGERDDFRPRVKNLLIFLTTLFVSISWFVPTFIKQSLISIDVNQWTRDFNFYNIFQLFVNYFGLYPMNQNLGLINIFAIIFILILATIIFGNILIGKELFSKKTFFASFFSFFLFLTTAYFTGNSLLYPRTAISLVLAFYVGLASSFSNFKYSTILVLFLVILQSSQLLIYFNQDKYYLDGYNFTDYRRNPINYYSNYSFPQNSCMFVIPDWNIRLADYFLDNIILVEFKDVFNNESDTNSLNIEKCDNYYLLEQSSLGEERLNEQYQRYSVFNFNQELIDQHENQNLYLLSND